MKHFNKGTQISSVKENCPHKTKDNKNLQTKINPSKREEDGTKGTNSPTRLKP